MNLTQIIAAKMEERILHKCGWINGRTVTGVARFYSRMIRGYRLLSPLCNRDTHYESCLGMGLAQ